MSVLVLLPPSSLGLRSIFVVSSVSPSQLKSTLVGEVLPSPTDSAWLDSVKLTPYPLEKPITISEVFGPDCKSL